MKVEQQRIKYLNNIKQENKNGDYILYMMQQSQRIEYNHTLVYTIEKANEFDKPVVVCFAIMPYFPNANFRHYQFMIEGIEELIEEFERRKINFVVEIGKYEDVLIKYSHKATMVITDKGYLNFQREIRKKAAQKLNIPFLEVESDVIIPVEDASLKEEPYAMTIRPKLISKIDFYLKEVKIPELKNKKQIFKKERNCLNEIIKTLKLEYIPPVTKYYKGGYSNATMLLKKFIDEKLEKYNLRNDPSKDYQSNLSPYLHFGQISPIEILIKVKKKNPHPEILNSFVNEIVVWRELARNFTSYNPNYDKYSSIPQWARNELEKHKKDPRKYRYSIEDLETSNTHDPYWNAANTELLKTGKIHNYMRMYWGKKVIEWTDDPQKAFEYLIYLNDKYAIDGRDPNGYASICWCFGKFDRPFFERAIFGKIRYMSSTGLEKKFDIQKYVEKIKNL